MAGLSRLAHRGLVLGAITLVCAALLAPIPALADTNLVIGGQAQIAYANGDDVRLRAEPGYGGRVLTMVPEGGVVDVHDGPVEADDGSLWYNVSYKGFTGYIISDYLAVYTGNGPVNIQDAASGSAPGAVIAYAVIAGTNNDGVRCRAAASYDAAVITVVPEGETVELTGDPVGVWQPINCAGQGGFVHTDFVSYDGSGSATGAPEAVGGETYSAAAVTGSAVVVGTSGGGLRCRATASTNAGIITVLAEGTVVELAGNASGRWQPVFCAGQKGWVHTDYISYDLSAASNGGGSGGSSTITGEAMVSGTNGDGLRCRSRGSFDASIITVLPEGSWVSLRGSAEGAWQPVVCAGSNGWVHTDFLSYDGTPKGGSGGGGSTSASGGDSVTGTAWVAGTNGDGLRCRAGASYSSGIITVLREGTAVDLRGSANGEWQPVYCEGSKGYVHVDFLSYDGPPSSGRGSGSGSSGGGGSSWVGGTYAQVSGTNGDGVRLRSDASFDAAIILVVREGEIVSVRDGSRGAWVAVSYSGNRGFIHGDYLVPSDGPSSGGGGSNGGGSSSSGGGRLSAGDHARTTADLNLRYDASTSAGIAAVAPRGTVVEITGGPSNGFYSVNWDGLRGYMHGDYLEWTDAALSKRGGSGAPAPGSGSGSNIGSGSGSALVDFAMQYLGYPYVWATHGPSSFDCSGFTYWVVLNVLGIDIGTGLWTQVSAGRSVSYNELRPGDLVFFQNTYTWGLSHVGIYIGNGQFIHAENENTGVVISNLSSPYYSSRWYGAVRLT